MNSLYETGPTFESRDGRTSAIDLTLVSSDLVNLISDWEVLNEETASDHKYITFSINERLNDINFKSTIKYKTNIADWSRFSSRITPNVTHIQNMISTINSSEEIEECVSYITSVITKACDKTFKKTDQNLVKKAGHKWWTRELTLQKQTVNRLRRQYQRCRQVLRRPLLRERYISQLEDYKKNITDTKVKSWNAFVAANSRENPWGLASKIARNKITKEVITELEGPEGTIITDSTQISEHLMNCLFPTDSQITDQTVHRNVRLKLQDLKNDITYRSEDDMDFTVQEVSDVINQQNPKKSPGLDGHTADIIQAVHKVEPNLLTSLFNKCLSFGYFPKLWKESVVKIIPKADKNNYKNPNSYRPISLLPVLAN